MDSACASTAQVTPRAYSGRCVARSRGRTALYMQIDVRSLMPTQARADAPAAARFVKLSARGVVGPLCLFS